eukprot:3363816-Amphidinium_carterae.1
MDDARSMYAAIFCKSAKELALKSLETWYVPTYNTQNLTHISHMISATNNKDRNRNQTMLKQHGRNIDILNFKS